MKTLLLGGIVGGIILYAWSTLAWMVLPLHTASIKSFKDEAAVSQVVAANAAEAGVYLMPYMMPREGESDEAREARFASTVQMFAAVRPKAEYNAGMLYGLQFVIMVLTALVMTWLLTRTAGLSTIGKATFAMMIGVAIALAAELPKWNWWGFSMAHTIAYAVDHIVGSFLAGLGIARFVKK